MSYDIEKKLTNDDFRKLFMTPRHPGDSGSSSTFAVPSTPASSASGSSRDTSDSKPKDKEKDDKRRKKKHFYAKIKKEEDDQMAELARKYRDRAKERRDGGDPITQRDELISAQGAYRAVAPDFRGNVDAAERRKQLIQESKFLGGDMEHTHLVKGLDYALLQKVRSELDSMYEEEQLEEKEKPEKPKPEVKKEPVKVEKAQDELGAGFHTKLGRNVYRAVFQNTPPERNELFAPGRMAYVMDLEDEYAESDIPTTLIRSKADVPNAEGQATLTTNDIVINKLAQILSYLRQGSKSSKKHKKVKDVRTSKADDKDSQQKNPDDSIYGDIGDYVPTVSKSKSSNHGSRHDSKDNQSRPKRQYFEKPKEEDERELAVGQDLLLEGGQKKRDREAWQDEETSARQGGQTFGSILKQNEKSMSRAQKLLSKINSQPEGYAECYPGFDEMHDAIEDSDEETDYSKMDPGKKKGSVGRWDFDTQEEYSEYMSNKEALPKAAFQFGVKMNDGRKTRKGAKTEKNEKAQLDRQWQQIQAIMHKRKGGDGGSKQEGEREPKTPKM